MSLSPPCSPHSRAGPPPWAITAPAVGRMFYSHFLLIFRGPGSDRRLVPVSLGPGSCTFGGLRRSMAALQTPDQGPSLPECLADTSSWNATWREVDDAVQNPSCSWHFPWLWDCPCSTFVGDLGQKRGQGCPSWAAESSLAQEQSRPRCPGWLHHLSVAEAGRSGSLGGTARGRWAVWPIKH